MENEKRLIDANVVLAKKFTTGLSDASGNYYGNADVVFADDIENAPTVDAVELPCKVGDTVYQVDANKIYPVTIKNLIYDAGHIAFDENAIGKSVFLTRKEAEAKLGGVHDG